LNTSLPPVAVLAGGLATRLHQLTETIPKSMLKVAGEPFIAHQLRKLKEKGIHRIVLCLGHLGEQIETFVRDQKNFGLNIKYVYDGDKLLGTGGAIKHALPYLEDHFFILYGDSWLEVDYRQTWKEFVSQGKLALMTVYRNEGRWDTSNVEMNGSRIKLYSKQIRNENMTHIDYGLSILTKIVFDDYPNDKDFDLSGIIETLAIKGDLASFEVQERFYEIGSEEGLAELEGVISQQVSY